MNFLQILAIVGTAATILGVFLTGYAVINNKTLKEESRLTREAIAKSEETIAKSIAGSQEVIAKSIVESKETIAKIIQETAKYLGDLIVSERKKA